MPGDVRRSEGNGFQQGQGRRRFRFKDIEAYPVACALLQGRKERPVGENPAPPGVQKHPAPRGRARSSSTLSQGTVGWAPSLMAGT